MAAVFWESAGSATFEAFELAHLQQCAETERLQACNRSLQEENIRLLRQVAALNADKESGAAREASLLRQLRQSELELLESRAEVQERNRELHAQCVTYGASETDIKRAERLHAARELDQQEQLREELAAWRRAHADLEAEHGAALSRLAAAEGGASALLAQVEEALAQAEVHRQRLSEFLSLDVKALADALRACGGNAAAASARVPFLSAGSVARAAAQSRPLDALMTAVAGLPSDGRLFEQFCCELLRSKGMRVTHCGQANDGGVDFTVVGSGPGQCAKKYVGQCKLYASKVGTATVREFCGAMLSAHCPNGILMCSGAFSRAAWALAASLRAEHGMDIDLWDAERIRLEAGPAARRLLAYIGGPSVGEGGEGGSEGGSDTGSDAGEVDPALLGPCSLAEATHSTACGQLNGAAIGAPLPSRESDKENATPCKNAVSGGAMGRVAGTDVWTEDEMVALRALVGRFRESRDTIGSPGGKTPGRARGDGEGRIPWGVICGHIQGEGAASVFQPAHVTKERLRSKWKNMTRNTAGL